MAFDMQKAMGLTPSQIAQANAASRSRDSSSGSSGSQSLNRTYGTRDEGEDSFTDQSTTLARKPDGTYAYVANSLFNGNNSYANPNENGLVYAKVTDQNNVDWSKVNPNTVLNDWRGRSGSGSSDGYDSGYGSNDYIDQLKQAQIAAATAALDKQKSGALSNLATEQAKIQSMATADRNTANIGMNNANQQWNESLASKGLNKSGSNALGTSMNQTAYLGNVGSINRDATNKEADIVKRTTDVNNNYLSDLAAAQAGAEATALQNYMNQQNTDKSLDYQKSRDAINDQRYTSETNYNQNQDTLNRTDKANETMGYVNPTANVVVPDSIRQQLAQYSNDYTAFANSTSDPTLKQYARALANEKIFSDPTLLAKYGNQYKTTQQKQQDWNNLFNQNEFNYQKQRDGVSDKQWQQTMNLNLRQQSFAEAQQKIDNALAQRRISQEDASQALQWARYNSDQDPNSFDNQLKKQQIDTNSESKANTNLNNIIDNIDKLYTYKDTSSGTVQVNPNTISSLRSYIIGLRLPDNQTDQLLLRYGLPINN